MLSNIFNDYVLTIYKIIRIPIKIRTNHDDDDDLLLESEDWKKYKHALSSQFTFYFPCDTYHNEAKNVRHGLDTPFLFNGSDSLCIIFSDKNTDDIDIYTSNVLQFNISEILPEWTDFVDEYSLEVSSINNNIPFDLTVRSFMEIMFDLGFEYKIDPASRNCFLKKEIKPWLNSILLNKKLNTELPSKETEQNKLKL